MHITFVKKQLADGMLCNKCRDVQRRLDESGHIDRIDEVLVAEEADAASPGMVLAAELGVERAPFFVVRDAEEVRVYESYFRFVKADLNAAVSTRDADVEILRQNPELDLI